LPFIKRNSPINNGVDRIFQKLYNRRFVAPKVPWLLHHRPRLGDARMVMMKDGHGGDRRKTHKKEGTVV
jgi:hypothetical protein